MEDHEATADAPVQRVLVTGGSRGLGRSICLAFARQGAQVAFTYHQRHDEALATGEALAATGPHTPLMFQGSVAQPEHARDTVAAVVDAWGGLDVLICTAAISQMLPFSLLEVEDFDQMMAVNVRGTFLFAREALKPMIRQRSGVIMAVGSFVTDRNVGAPIHYAASKGAVRAMCAALAGEVGRYDIRVLCLEPGLLDRGMSRRVPRHRITDWQEQSALGQLLPADEVADSVVWLASPQNSFMTGTTVSIDGGI